MVKKIAVFTFIALFFSCARPGRLETGLLPAEVEADLARADGLYNRANFVALKQACEIYAGYYGQPRYRRAVAGRLFRTCLLLSVREKEIGISNTSYLDRALVLIKDNRSLSRDAVYAEIAGFFWVQGKGVMQDIDTRFAWRATEDTLRKAEADLRLRSAQDPFSAYMYAGLRCAFAPAHGVSFFLDEGDLARLWGLFPDSPLLKFKRATCPKENAEILKELIAADPEFYEADYFLGNEALSRGNLLEAEEFFLKSLAGIPESPQAAVSLASIALATEEFERSLDYYDKTLALAPEYRDALLGKAIDLSYLGRPSEAIAVCEKLISLGYWLLGEGYYWLAWNQHELKDNAAAAVSIEEAKGRLPTSSEVFTLSGTIALEEGDIAKAEKDLREALRYNRANAEALMRLGDVLSRKKEWADSAACFERAGFIYDDEEAGLEAKIADVRKSRMAEERKNALLRRKMRQLERTSLAKASAFYSAGAEYSNCGQKQKAVETAARAAEHPSFKQKAEDLISRIKSS
jgi:tetratricopeptide (TPR) repeat protein